MKWIKCFCLLADLTFLLRADCFESVAEVFVSGESWETLNGSLIEKRNCCNYFRSAGQQQSKVSRIVCPNNTCCWFLFVLLLQRTTTATTKHHKRNRADKNRCFLHSASFLIPWMNNFFDFVLDSPSLTLCSRLGAFFSNETVQYLWTNFGFTVNITKLIIHLYKY
jgi:hypothetical protein